MQFLSRLMPAIIVALLFTSHAATAESPKPKLLGTFGAWRAARYVRNGHILCYSFSPALTVKTRRPPAILTVLKRKGGRTDIILSPGFALPRHATIPVSAGSRALAFSAYGRHAFARNRDAAVQAFRAGATVTAETPGPQNRKILQTFSLNGFSAAYDTVIKACAS